MSAPQPRASYAYMSCPPYNAAAGCCAVGLSCTIPYFFGLHSNSFPFNEYGSYARVATFAILVFNLFAGWTAVKFTNKTNCLLAIICFSIGLLSIAFNLAFGIRSASIVSCQETVEVACLESTSGTCHVTGNVRMWMGILYLFGLAVAMCSQSYMVYAMLQRAGWGLEFQKIEELINSSRVELSALEGKSVSVEQPTALVMPFEQKGAPKLIVTTESSSDSSGKAGKKGGRQPAGPPRSLKK